MAPDSLPTPFPVLVHPFPSPTPGTCAYEHVAALPAEPLIRSAPAEGEPKKKAALVFIGGLGDGPHTVPFVRAIAARLAAGGGEAHEAEGPGASGAERESERQRQRSAGVSGLRHEYSVFEVRLASSFAGWGFTSLAGDVGDLAALVAYLRGIGRERVVLMGHSTGSQDCVEYADRAKHQSPLVDGFILQGPVSDREGIVGLMPRAELDPSLAHAARLIAEGNENVIMPRDKLPSDFTTPVTAYRWHSLTAAGGDDDFFSSDLSEGKIAAIWSRFAHPVLVLPSENDEYIPASVDFADLLDKWRRLAPPGIVSPLSGLIPGADHSVSQTAAREWTAETVVQFLRSLE